MGPKGLEYPALLQMQDRRGIAAHCLLAALGIEESKTRSVSGILKLTYLDRRNQEIEQTHDLTSSLELD